MTRSDPYSWYDVPGWFSQADAAIYRSLVERARSDSGTMVEVGVWKGRSLISVLPHATALGYKYIGAVDTWQGSPGERASYHREAAEGDIKRAFLHELDQRGLLDYVTVHSIPSVAAADLHKDNSLDLVFLDGDHSQPAVYADIKAWLPKVRAGGILAGHDVWWHSVREGLHASGIAWQRSKRDDSSIWYVEVTDETAAPI